MKTLEFSLNKSIYIPDYISPDETICFLDIETDGLSHSFNNVILIGAFIVTPSSSEQKLFQVFAESEAEEPLILNKLNQLISDVDTIFTYNGASFDLPFLKKRFYKHGISHDLDSFYHIDLMKKVKKNKDFLLLENCRLKTVEKKVGIEREDTISGRDSVLLYREYLKTKSAAVEKTILRHNYEDIYYLPDILKIEKLLGNSTILNFSISGKSVKVDINVDKIKISKSMLKASGTSQLLNIPDYIVFEDSYSFSWITSDGHLNIEFLIESGFDESGRALRYIDNSDLPIDSLVFPFDNMGLDITSNIVPLSIDKDIIYANVLKLVESTLKKHI